MGTVVGEPTKPVKDALVIATVPFLNWSMLLVPVTARVGVTAAAVPVEVVAAYAVTTPLAAADDVGV